MCYGRTWGLAPTCNVRKAVINQPYFDGFSHQTWQLIMVDPIALPT